MSNFERCVSIIVANPLMFLLMSTTQLLTYTILYYTLFFQLIHPDELY